MYNNDDLYTCVDNFICTYEFAITSHSESTIVIIICTYSRQPGQDTTDEIKSRDFRQELEKKEKEARRLKDKDKMGRFFTGQTP